MKSKLVVLFMAMVLSVMTLVPTWSHAEGTLKIGVAAMISPKETFKYYQAILDYVGAKVGQKVELVQRPTYADMDKSLKEESVQVAFVCSGPYIMDQQEFGVELLVAPVSYGKPFYNAYIIANIDSPLNSLAALKGKSFAFTDPHSNTGKIAPEYMVVKGFGTPVDNFFSKIIYSKSHDKSMEMVAKNMVDGASVDSLIYDFAAKTDPTYTKLTKIIEKSPEFGIPPIVVTKGVDSKLKESLRTAFLTMHEDAKGKEILSKIGVDKFIVPDDKNYDSVREMEKWLKVQKH